jgi:outer membrane protein assembly factor BamA
MRNGWIIATRGLAGVIDPSGARPTFTPVASAAGDSEVARVPLEDRFRGGGVNSIRGYDENSLPPPGSGGLALAQGSLELRVPTPVRLPFLGTLGLEIYGDVGNIWPRPAFMTWDSFSKTRDDDPNAIRVVGGIGPRVDLPIGPLRIDVTWHARPTPSHPVIQFAIGPSF